MAYRTDLSFNPKTPAVMHIDLNSCFATIEQQANPLLRGIPVAVAAYTTPNGCIIAPSVEAKSLGITVGMRVKDGKLLCPGLVVLPPDPWKYRSVHLALRRIVSSYTNNFTPKSIDEFTLNLEGYPILQTTSIKDVAREIKERIKNEIGEWIRVSIGIAANRFLAKVAAGLRKPDGLDEISKENYFDIYSRLPLTKLCGIKTANAIRLGSVGVHSTLDFFNADYFTLRSAFKSINAYYWYLRLRGWEIDDVEFGRKSYGNSYALPKPFSLPEELSPILIKLTEKTGRRMRRAGYEAEGVHFSVLYRDFSFWHKGFILPKAISDSRDIYRWAFKIMLKSPHKKPVRNLAVSVFNLRKGSAYQLDLFEDVERRRSLVASLDEIGARWGDYSITPARMLLGSPEYVPDRVAFGGVKELEEFTLG
jgi:DNA polymerase IV